MNLSQRSYRPATRRHALNMVEVIVSTMLVSVVLVSALDTVGGVIRGRVANKDADSAELLTTQLMAEIMACNYLEPTDPPTFGREASESTTNRSDWDDVDDYHTLSSSPPTDRGGTPLANSAGWGWNVIVEWVDPVNPSAVVGSDLGVKRITVTVQRQGKMMAQETALRTNSYLTGVP